MHIFTFKMLIVKPNVLKINQADKKIYFSNNKIILDSVT